MGFRLSPDRLRRMDAYWRATNYLCVGMLYLRRNPLLREPLTPEHIKDRPLGHRAALERVGVMYRDPERWARAAVLNVARSGKFFSDRTIAEYAAEIWNCEPCPVPWF